MIVLKPHGSLLKEKSEVILTLKQFHQMIWTQFNAKLQVVRSDKGREYLNQTLGNYFLENGIIHQTSWVGIPQQNRVAERKNKHLLEVDRALMFATNVPKFSWGDVVLTTAHKKPKLQDFNRYPKTTPTSWLSSTQSLWLYYICPYPKQK